MSTSGSSPWQRFTRWFQRLFTSEKPTYPKIIGTPTETKICMLMQYERFEDGACYTWRAIPKYEVYPADAHIFLLCDDLKGVPRKNQLATHRLTVAIVGMKFKQKYWCEDFEMTSDWGEGNCAWIVSRLLAGELLRNQYQKVKWSELAKKYVEHNRQGVEKGDSR